MFRSPFLMLGLCLLMPLTGFADYSLESLMRAYQERYKASESASKTWPVNLASDTAPEFPPDGFYARGVTDPASSSAYTTLRAQIINAMYDGVNGASGGDDLLDGWLLQGDLEGAHHDNFASNELKGIERPVTSSLDQNGKIEVIARRLKKMEWRTAGMLVEYKRYRGVATNTDAFMATIMAYGSASSSSPTISHSLGGSAPFPWLVQIDRAPPFTIVNFQAIYEYLTATVERPADLSAVDAPTVVDFRPYYTLISPSSLSATDTPPVKIYRSLPEGREVKWEPNLPVPLLAGGEGTPFLLATARYKFRYNPEENCGCTKCAPGSVDAKVSSLHFSLGLGLTDGAQSSASLEISAENPGPLLAKPEGLHLPAGRGVTIVRDSSTAALKQIVTAEHVVDVTVSTARQYHLDWYLRSSGAPASGTGLYPHATTRLSRLTVENPNAGNANTLNVKRYDGTATTPAQTWSFVYDLDTHTWALTDSLNPFQEKLSTSSVEITGITYFIEDRQTFQASTLVSHRRSKYRNFPFGRMLVEEVNDPNGKNDITTTTYYTNSVADTVNYGLVKQITQPSGAWTRYAYDDAGRVVKTVSSYLDTPDTAPETSCRVTTVSYQTTSQLYTLMIEKLQDIEISRRYMVKRVDGTDDILCTQPGAAVNAASNLITHRNIYVGGDFAGRTKSVINPDGTGQLITYTADTVDPVTGLLNAAQVTTITKSGAWNVGRTDITAGTQTTSKVNRQGQVIESKTTDIDSGLTIAHTQATDLDAYGRILTELNVLSGQEQHTVYDCCGLASTTDYRGITTTYARSATENSQTTLGVTSKTVTQGLTTLTLRQGSDLQWLEMSRSTVNVAGETVSSYSRSPGAVTQTYAHDLTNHREVHTQTFADGGTVITTTYPDGTPDRTTGTAVHPALREEGVQLGVNVDGVTQNVRWVKESALTAAGALSGEWTRTWTDFAGRVWKMDSANGGVSRTHYNAIGQRIKAVDPDGVATLFAYDTEGQLIVTAVDMDRDDVIDYNGTDRITRSTKSYTTRAGAVVERQVTEVWDTDNVNTPVTLRTADRSADGLQSWITEGTLTTQSIEDPDSGGWDGSWTVTTIYPDTSTMLATYTSGRLSSQVRRDSASSIVDRSDFQYDAHGRLWKVADGRSATTTQTYEQKTNPVSGGSPVTADLVETVLTPPKEIAGTGSLTTNSYDAMGRKETVTDALGGTVITTYYPTGEVHTTSGTRAYPVSFTYTAQGRVASMTTTTNAGPSITTWFYHATSGLLQEKKLNAATAYTQTYTLAGRLSTSTGARSIVTTYGYTNAGDQASINYSDSTPDVTLTYNRLGHLKTASDGTLTDTLSTNVYGQLQTESWTGALHDGVALTRSFDSLRRQNGMTATQGATSLASYGLGYDHASRVQTVTTGNLSATYAYLPQSRLPDTLTYKRSGTTYATADYEFDLAGNLKWIKYQNGAGTPLLGSTYEVDDIHRRTKVTREDGTRWDWGHNDRGEIESASRKFADATPVPLEQFAYTYDAIGNRLTSSVAGRETSYTPNFVNQYTARSNPGYAHVTGEAQADANVVINRQVPTRKDNLFWQELVAANSTAGAYLPVKTFAAKPGAATAGADLLAQESRTLYVPPASQTLTYDADGNLQTDGRWTYTWDGANRLIAMEEQANASLTTAGLSRQKLEFTHDPFGRRATKKVSTWDAGASAWIVQKRSVFVWHRWNLIAELEGAGSTLPTLKHSYIWGLDAGKTSSTPGGVGGLLFEQLAGVWVTPCFDGNGNVIKVLDVSTSGIVAEFDYDPFGRVLHSSGKVSSDHHIQFSSRYHDSETTLSYYGYRYYNPDLGRWLSKDPIEEKGGLNLYAFVANDGVNFTDELGLTPCPCPCDKNTPDLTQQLNDIVNKELDYFSKANKGFMKSASTLRNFIEMKFISGGQGTLSGIEKILEKMTPSCLGNPLLSRVMKLCERCVGTDKIGHFFEEGLIYYDIAYTHKKGVDLAKKFGLWTEGMAINHLTADEFDFLERPNITVNHGGKQTKLPGFFSLYGLLGDWGFDKNGDSSPADIAANESGLSFWETIMASNGSPGSFDICKYVNDSWDHLKNPNIPTAPKPSRP